MTTVKGVRAEIHGEIATCLCHPTRLVSEAEWQCHVCRDAILRVSSPGMPSARMGRRTGCAHVDGTVEQ